MATVKFIHCADIHLDSPMSGLRQLPDAVFSVVQESTFQSFHRIVNLAMEEDVDFLIIAGDLFDQDNRSIRAQARFRKEMERLKEKGIHVFLSFGNHDYDRKRFPALRLPDNVHIFSEKVEAKPFTTKNGAKVHLYGFSYPANHVIERKIDEYVKKEGADFHIGILHGQMEGMGGHHPYAPFRLEDLLQKGFDYWALGHIHKREILYRDPPVIYPGNTQGRHMKETGPKGCYLVELCPLEAGYQFVETAPCVWEQQTLDGSIAHSFDDLYVLCEKSMDKIRREGKGVFVQWTIEHFSWPEGLTYADMEEMLAYLRDEEKEKDSFVWPLGIKFTGEKQWSREALCEESDFYRELFSVIDSFGDMDEALAPLYQHHAARKFLTPLSEKDLKEIKEEAAALLIRHFTNLED